MENKVLVLIINCGEDDIGAHRNGGRSHPLPHSDRWVALRSTTALLPPAGFLAHPHGQLKNAAIRSLVYINHHFFSTNRVLYLYGNKNIPRIKYDNIGIVHWHLKTQIRLDSFIFESPDFEL